MYKVSENSLSRVDFWHALMDPSHGSAQDLPRTRGRVGGVLKYLHHGEVAKKLSEFLTTVVIATTVVKKI